MVSPTQEGEEKKRREGIDGMGAFFYSLNSFKKGFFIFGLDFTRALSNPEHGVYARVRTYPLCTNIMHGYPTLTVATAVDVMAMG